MPRHQHLQLLIDFIVVCQLVGLYILHLFRVLTLLVNRSRQILSVNHTMAARSGYDPETDDSKSSMLPTTPPRLIGTPGWTRTSTEWIFLPHYVTIAAILLRCSLDHVFTIFFSNLGGGCMASTHLGKIKFST